MNHRERFLATLNFGPVDRVPLIELGYWPQTVELWKLQGMTGSPNDPGKDVQIPARAVVKFKPGKEMREQVLRLTEKYNGPAPQA